jgi:ATP-dependent Lhr-like helicase
VLAGAEPVLYVERGGRGLNVLVDHEDERVRPALETLAAFVRAGRIKKLDIERADGLGELLIELGFKQGPKKLTLTA